MSLPEETRPKFVTIEAFPAATCSPQTSSTKDAKDAKDAKDVNAAKAEGVKACSEMYVARALQRAADIGDVAALRTTLPQAVTSGVSAQVIDAAYERCSILEAEAWTARLRRSALQTLREALRACDSDPPEVLSFAVAHARDVGALLRGDELLERAREELEKRQARAEAEDALLVALRAVVAVELAVSSVEAPAAIAEALVRAVDRAQALGAGSPELLAHARGRVALCKASAERWQARAEAEQELLDHLDSKSDAAALSVVLEKAREVGVGRRAIDKARERKVALELQAWEAERSELAGQKLRAMINGMEESAEALRAATEYAAELGALGELLTSARRRVTELESESSKKRCSLFGASPGKPRASPAKRVFSSAIVPSYGLDVELKAKAAAKYDAAAEEEAAQWIQAITGVKVVGDFFGALCTGEVLCQLLNAIRPGTIQKVNDAGMPFKERENISHFLKACRMLGVQEYALFSTDDLYEKNDLQSVVRCIHALGGALRRSVPEFQGPQLGVADTSKAKRDQKREFGPVTQTGGLYGAMERCHIDVTSNQIVRGGC